MKALSIHPFFACQIMAGNKTVECRSWSTDYRGEILICSTRKLLKDTIPGHALCTVKLLDVVPFTKDHLKAACLDGLDVPENHFAWILGDLRDIRPFPIKGHLSLWNYDGPIEYLEPPKTDEEDERMYHEIWEPLFV